MKVVSNPTAVPALGFRMIAGELEEVERRLELEALTNLPVVHEINHYVHESGGKRLRPALVLLASRLCGAPVESSIQLGVVVELVHVATLVHDDIIDNSVVRRGRPSVNSRWGNEVTVLFGDWLYMTGYALALRERNFRILDVLTDLTRKMVEGELLQLEFRHRLDTTINDYLSICWHKTAHLFSACGRFGAILGNVPAQTEERLAKFGRTLGMAFQLVDDLLDYTADAAILGKPVLKDLQEGNVTFPIISFLERAEPEEREFVHGVVESREFTAENKAEIVRLVERYGILDELRRLARSYAEEAHGCLSVFPDSDYRGALLDLADLVIHRDR